MNAFEITAQKDRKRFNQIKYQFEQECKQFRHAEYDKLEESFLPQLAQGGKAPVMAWRNRYYLAALFDEGKNQARLSVNRTALKADGKWSDGITWDELMEVKRGIGLGNEWAVEVYPPDSETVNVANMRHLFLVGQPAFAWVRKCAMPKRNPMLKGFWETLAGGFRKP